MCKFDAIAFGLNWVELGIVAILFLAVISLLCLFVKCVINNRVEHPGYNYPNGYQPLWNSETRTPQPPPKKP